MDTKGFLAAIDARLAELTIASREIEEERGDLLRLRQRYARSPSGREGRQAPLHLQQQRQAIRRTGSLGFLAMEGGPTEAVLAVIREHQGLNSSDLIDRAIVRLKTSPKHPRRIISQTAMTLVRTKRLSKRSGKFYLGPAEEAGEPATGPQAELTLNAAKSAKPQE